MPTSASRRGTRRRKKTLAKTATFEASIEEASNYPSFEQAPIQYRDRLMKNLKRILKRKHLPTVVREITKGNNNETYTEEYAEWKNRNVVNVRSLKAIISGEKRYTPQGPTDFVASGGLMNSLVSHVRIKGNEVHSSLVVGRNSRRNDDITNRELVEILDDEKNLRQHALDAVRRKKKTLIIGTLKKAIAQANAGR